MGNEASTTDRIIRFLQIKRLVNLAIDRFVIKSHKTGAHDNRRWSTGSFHGAVFICRNRTRKTPQADFANIHSTEGKGPPIGALLSPAQVTIVQKSWSSLKHNADGFVCKALLKLFEDDPNLTCILTWSDIPLNRLVHHKMFTSMMKQIVTCIDMCVSHARELKLVNVSQTLDDTEKYLQGVGRLHQKLHSRMPEYFEAFQTSILEEIDAAFDDYSEKDFLTESWSVFMEYMISHLITGLKSWETPRKMSLFGPKTLQRNHFKRSTEIKPLHACKYDTYCGSHQALALA